MRTSALPPVLLLLPLLAACGQPQAALQVGEIRFGAGQVAHLSEERREELIDLAALAESIREQRLEELVSPVAERQAMRERLPWLGRALAARQIGDEELARRYSAAPEHELRVRHVLRLAERGAPPEVHERASRVAEEVRARAAAGDSFPLLAARYSEEPGAARREGLLGWGREGDWVEPFWRAAAALEPGEVSPVVQTVYGYHVLRLEEERPVPVRSLSRAALLRRTVTGAEARRALDDWLSSLEGQLTPHPPAILRAQRAARGAEVLADSAELVSWPGGSYTYRDLLADLALLDAAERSRRLAADETVFGAALLEDARRLMWLDAARADGVVLPAADPREAREEWSRTVAGWGRALGLAGGNPRTLPERALRALAATGQEARIARARLTALRFRLRELYPPSPSSSSSE